MLVHAARNPAEAAIDPAAKALRFIRFWLGSIAVHVRRPGDDSLPPIVLVGTHGDQVTRIVGKVKREEEGLEGLDDWYRNCWLDSSVRRQRKLSK